ncbi:MAG: stage III sporulation protein AG [Lachnospiraceae bacterium]|nr:stage III sporulation protein AG [Lachnospiraceae bacterium]
MKNEIGEKMKKLFLQKDSIMICILTGILLLVIAWPVEKNEKKEKTEGMLWDMGQANIDYEEQLQREGAGLSEEAFFTSEDKNVEEEISSAEKKLEELLSFMEGAGKVKVMITLDSLGEKVLEKDTPVERNVVTETDAGGGSRNTNNMNSQESTVYITDSRGNKIPYVVTETLPAVKGVTVVCSGGDNDLVEKNITEVIQALFGIEVHKIKIVKMKQLE